MSEPCPICGTLATPQKSGGYDQNSFVCPRCGKYTIGGTALAVWRAGGKYSPRVIANVSGWIKDHPGINISSNDIDDLFKLDAPSVGDRAEKLMLEISRRSRHIGDVVEIPYDDRGAAWLGVSWSENSEELQYLIKYLCLTKEWLEPFGTTMDAARAVITPAGYQFLEMHKHGSNDGSQGFCAMWFAKGMTPLWADAIEPAITDAGYKAVRIDRIEHTNRIDDEILAQIRRSKFVVADFSGQRRGVYFEAGFALGLGRQVIWTIRKGCLNNIHFDNRQYNFLEWDPENLHQFRKALQYRIESIFGVGPMQPTK